MRISWHPSNAQASAVMLAGLIAMPIAVLPGHVAPTKPVTATVRAGVPQRASHMPQGASHMPSASVPALSIGVSDGRTAVKTGDQLTYVVSVRDGGTRSAPHLKITQTLSAGLEFLSASPHGTAANGQVAWYAGIPAGGTQTFRVVARVTRPPAQAAPAGGGRLRRGGRQQQADCLCGPPRPVARRCGRAGVPGRQALPPDLVAVCRGGPGGACGRRARADRIPSPPPAAGRA